MGRKHLKVGRLLYPESNLWYPWVYETSLGVVFFFEKSLDGDVGDINLVEGSCFSVIAQICRSFDSGEAASSLLIL